MQSFFSNRLIYTGTAPGRMDVMGGIADYCGSLLLQMPIREKTTVKCCKRKDNLFRIITDWKGELNQYQIQFPLHHLDWTDMRNAILAEPGGDWAIYVAGCFLLLQKENLIPVEGADVMITSEVPPGKGVSSSAALEVATMIALSKAYNLHFDDLQLPQLAQKVENYIVGAPCGLMDQLSAYLGTRNRLLPLICQPASVYPSIDLPKGLKICGIDSGIRHAVSGASYSEVRTAAFMGYSIIASVENIKQEILLHAGKTGKWNVLPYKGYLSNIPASLYEQKYAHHLPEEITGREFIEKYGATIDPVTKIRPESIYQVKSCTEHPIYENNRVQTFYQLLQSVPVQNMQQKRTFALLGELMFQSHASYSRVGLGNSNTDEIVNEVRQAGIRSGIYGAKITGGGSGGTVCILYAGKKGWDTVQSIYKNYVSKYGKVNLFNGSSDGGYYRK